MFLIGRVTLNIVLFKNICISIQGGPEFMVQTLMIGRRHEDKHYSVEYHRAQTSSVGARER